MTSSNDQTGRGRSVLAAAASLLLTLTLTLSLGPGCAFERTVLDDSVVDTLGGVDQEFDFWDEVATRPAVTNNDALHGLLILSGVGDLPPSYDDRLTIARAKGWIVGPDRPPADESATIGMMSLAICDILEIEGGVVMRLFGPSPRHCTREIVYLGIIPDRTENQTLTGLEFSDLVRRAADRLGAADDGDVVAAAE